MPDLRKARPADVVLIRNPERARALEIELSNLSCADENEYAPERVGSPPAVISGGT
ncbi:MAG: hypothetical protein AAF346_05315 [Pseudomonadota bacterium]